MTGLLRADKVQPENIEWLWRERIPKGMFSMIAGRPDQGKSMIATTIAADITRAGGNVLYSSKERSFGLMEWPRFVAAGGVQKRMFYWRFSLPRQMDELAEYIEANSIQLCVLDPVNAHFIGVSMTSDRCREILNPLVELAERTGCAFLFIEHALKKVAQSADPLTAIRGNSSGLPASCAMAYLFGTDPRDPEHKILACVKHNICEGRDAMRFEIDTEDVEGIRDPVPVLLHKDEIKFDAMRLVARAADDVSRGPGRPNAQLQAASEWLTKYLGAAAGPVRTQLIKEDAKQFGHTNRTLRRAATHIGVVRQGGGPNMTWELPEELREFTGPAVDRSTVLEPPAERGPARDVLAWIRYVEAEIGETSIFDIPEGEDAELEGLITDEELRRWMNG